MKNILSAVLIAALIIPAMQGCKKYDEGPAVSLKSKKSRLTNIWELEKEVEADGTVEYPNSTETMELKKDGTVFINGVSVSGFTWSLSDDKEYVEFSSTWQGFTVVEKDKIIRLTSDELWLRDSDGDQNYWISQ